MGVRSARLRRVNAKRLSAQALLSPSKLLAHRLEKIERQCENGQPLEAGSVLRHRLLMRPFESEAELQDGQRHLEKIAELLREETESTVRPRWMINPNSLRRKLWDSAALLLIYTSLVAVPMQVAFYSQIVCKLAPWEGDGDLRGASASTGGWWLFNMATTLFFAIDIVLNCITGRYDDVEQRVDYNLRRVVLAYARSFMVTDIIACLPLNCIMTQIHAANYWNLGELLKLLRLIGIWRRGHGSPLQWIDRLSELRREFSFNARRLLSFALAVLEVAHCCACLLWLVLRVEDFPPGTWPVQLNLLDAPVAEQWLFSYFAIVSAQIGLGYGSYPPITWPEALVWVFIMLIVAGMWAILGGLIVSFIMASSIGRQEYKDKMDRLLQFLKDRQVPGALRARIMEYMMAKYKGHRVDHDAEVMQDLPPAIRSQLALLSHGSLLAQLPLFARHPLLLEDIAPLLTRAVAVPGQVIVQDGHLMTAAYFLSSGFVDITCDLRSLDTLGAGDCLAEVALLPPPKPSAEVPRDVHIELLAGARWRATFTATALSYCEMVSLPADRFQAALREHPEVAAELSEVAHSYMLRAARASVDPLGAGSAAAGNVAAGGKGPAGQAVIEVNGSGASLPSRPASLQLGDVGHARSALPHLARRHTTGSDHHRLPRPSRP